MRRTKVEHRVAFWSLALVLVLSACSKVPSSVIQPEEMAQLMADVHTAEGVIELNRLEYRDDSMRRALRQSVFIRHGVTPEQVDSSLSWYGRNISFYMDMYDRTIEILEHRLIESGNRMAAAAALSIAGDSVDVWAGPRLLRVHDRLPSKFFTFVFEADPNWERGDSYTWRAKFFNSTETARWGFVTEYDNGTIEFMSSNVSGDGWHEINFITDSTHQATRIYGYLAASNRTGTESVIDSVEMVRKRINRDEYTRRYGQRRLTDFVNTVGTDTEAGEDDAE